MGIKLSNAKLSKMLRSFESHMPEPHRAFLHRIRSFEHSNIRDSITSLCSLGTTEAAALVQKYNAVIDRILDFRWRHLHFVRKFIVEQSPEASRASGTYSSNTHSLNQGHTEIHNTHRHGRFACLGILDSTHQRHFKSPNRTRRFTLLLERALQRTSRSNTRWCDS